MGDISQGHPGVKQAVCIKPYKNQGINFQIDLLEIVTLEQESKNLDEPKLIWVKNERGHVWYFIKHKKDGNELLFTTAPQLNFFEDHFKELK